MPRVPRAGEVGVLAGMVGKEEVSRLSWRTWGDAWFLMPGPEPAVLYKGLVLLVRGIILGCVLLMLKLEPEEEQLSWLCSTSRNKKPLKCIWVSRAGCAGAHRGSGSHQ